MSNAEPMGYNERARRYFRQRHIDPGNGFFYTRFTPAQRRRALKKERHSWRVLTGGAPDLDWPLEARRA